MVSWSNLEMTSPFSKEGPEVVHINISIREKTVWMRIFKLAFW